MKSTKHTFVRDLSWLAFNARVLQEAKDPSVHIYERLRFLGIFSNNLDEFYRVRVATLNRMVRLGKSAKVHLEANPEKILKQIVKTVAVQQTTFDHTYADIISEMEKAGIFIKNDKQLSRQQTEFVHRYFDEHVRTQLVPLMIESIPQIPLLNDKSIYLACVLGSTENPMYHRYALIPVPSRRIPRFLILPSEKGTKDIILLEDVIRLNLPHLFAPFGFNRFMGHIVKITRDAELEIDGSDISTNLIADLEKGLKNRKKGITTRFIYDRNIDEGLLDYLTKRLNLSGKDTLSPGGRIHNFKDFMDFPVQVFRDVEPRRKPFVHPLLVQPRRIMEVLDKRDVMLHFPYHSFDSVIDLVREAAIDPFVQSIKITCYRLAKNSKIVNALTNATRNGKQVTVMLEVRARFDEEANLEWKRILEDEGVKVILGIPGMKVHAKICIIKKREFNITKQYGFIATGNFNEGTARFYGDHCLMTTNRNILADINRIFSLLEDPTPNLASLKTCKTLAVAPQMRRYFMDLIDEEIKQAKKKKPASIQLKLNSIVDELLIHKLYEAASAGVEIKMVVRGIFGVYPDQKGFKKPIEAISIIDQYLEHARVLIFHNEGKPKVYISSADWMVRNLDHRIEAACPIYNHEIQQELIDIFNIQLAENVKGRILDNHQHNAYVQRHEHDPEVRSQVAIYDYLLAKTYD